MRKILSRVLRLQTGIPTAPKQHFPGCGGQEGRQVKGKRHMNWGKGRFAAAGVFVQVVRYVYAGSFGLSLLSCMVSMQKPKFCS
jgi:hypothetical protein